MAYATKTEVPVSRTIAELDTLLGKYGATGFAFGRDDEQHLSSITFRIKGRVCRFEVTQPTYHEFRTTANQRWRGQVAAQAAADAEYRRRWRVRFLLIKALLVAVDEDAATLTEVFLPYLVLPGGATFAEWAEPQLERGTYPQVIPGVRAAIEAGTG